MEFSTMRKDQGQRLIKAAKASFEDRPEGREGMLFYLSSIYETIRKHRSWIGKKINKRLKRKPKTDDLFSHLIEITSDLDPKLRSKYAKVLRIADENDVHSSEFESFVKGTGGFNKVIERRMARSANSHVSVSGFDQHSISLCNQGNLLRPIVSGEP